MFEFVDCNLCEGRCVKPFCRENGFQVVECKECGFVFTNPRLRREYLIDSYQNYLPERVQEIEDWNRMMEKVFSNACSKINKISKTPGKILDIGCGYGLFLKKMKDTGWDATGVEVSKPAVDFGRRRFGVNILQDEFEALDLEENYYDVVTLFYVIEHFRSPRSVLLKVKKILKSGGFILIRWPDTVPIIKILKSLGIRMNLCNLPFHLSHFSSQTIDLLLREVGFSNLQTYIGGFTNSLNITSRSSSLVFGLLAESLFKLSGGKYLLPGVSKTTIAKNH